MLLNQHEKLAALQRTEEKTMTQAEEYGRKKDEGTKKLGKDKHKRCVVSQTERRMTKMST
jgi:hypothetical protein